MTDIRYKVMAARLGELDVRFRMNVGTRVIEVTRTLEWGGVGNTLDEFLAQQARLAYYRLLQLASGTNLGQYVGQRGTITLPPNV